MSRFDKSSRATEYINSVCSEHEDGMFLNWRNDAQKEGRSATQILQQNAVVIKEMEAEGKVPFGAYERVMNSQEKDSQNKVIEVIEPCDESSN